MTNAYVYFDNAGNISAITQTPNNEFIKDNKLLTVDITLVSDFLTGVKSTGKFKIINNVITPSKTYTKPTRSINDWLSKVTTDTTYSDITITAYLEKHVITVELNNKDISSTLNDLDIVVLYFTKKNNPYYLIYSLPISPIALCTDDIQIAYDKSIDLSNSSVYAKRFTNKCNYIIEK